MRCGFCGNSGFLTVCGVYVQKQLARVQAAELDIPFCVWDRMDGGRGAVTLM
jgi:hypothetical protein